ncbi:MAG: tRNA lysidine(34) synthetase TilS [Candidatus Kapabacteria bacterium]|nr:tRNA lysidine(34) synthetase TilS [Candidatus Kapabacteria bacterium]
MTIDNLDETSAAPSASDSSSPDTQTKATKSAAKKSAVKKSAAKKPAKVAASKTKSASGGQTGASTPEAKPTAKKSAAKKPAAKKPAAKTVAPVIPDVEELTAFVESLKSKIRKPVESDDDEHTQPAPQQQTAQPAKQQSQRNNRNAQEPKLQQLKQQLHKSQQQQQVQEESAPVAESGDSDVSATGESQQISKREQRRLQWIEKQRQRREQRFLERQKRREERGELAEEPSTNADHDDTVESRTDAAQQPQDQPQQHIKSQPQTQPQQQQKNKQAQPPAEQRGGKQQRGNQRRGGKNAPQEPPVESEEQQPYPVEMPDGDADAVTVTDVRSVLAGFRKYQPDIRTDDNDDDDNASIPAEQSKRGGRRSRGGNDSRQPRQQEQSKNDTKKDSRQQPNDGGNQQGKQQGKQQDKQQGKQQGKPQAKQQGKQQGKPQRDTPDTDGGTPPIPEASVAPPLPKRYFIPKDITLKPDVPDAVHGILEKVERYLHDELLVDEGANIVIGVSGGVDSIVLLDMLYIISFESGFNITVAHVNHNLRGADSKRDEKFVRTVSTNYKVQFHTTQVQVKEFAKRHSLSEEEAARELRYKFFRQTAGTVRANYCATAHTADDAAETMLMNLFRGTGLTGLSSIPPRRPLVKKTTLIRPLLCLSKAEILEYATARGLEWHDDETNTLTKYTRNKVRHDLLPKIKEDYNPNIIESLNRTASLLRKADGFIDSLIHSTYTEIVTEHDDKTTMDVNKLSALHEFLQGEIIERAMTSITFGKTVSFAAIDRITSLFTKEAGTRETIINNLIALRERDSIVLMYDQHIQEVYLSLYKLGTYSVGQYTITLDEVHRNDVRIGQDPNVEYLDYDRLPYRLTLRTWHAGDTFHPIGMNGHTNVSDFLTNAKIEHSERSNVLVLTTATDIAWVCGMRMSDDFKITNDTRRIIRATYHKK